MYKLRLVSLLLLVVFLPVDGLAQPSVTLEQAQSFIDTGMQALAPVLDQAKRGNVEANIITEKDVPYQQSQGVDPARLSLDLYTTGEKINSPCKPLLLYIHGGGWLGGDKALALFKPAEFVPSGYVFASANYRFRPDASLLEMVQSVADAVGWLHREAPKHGADPNRIFLMGHSAGAHLVSVLGTNPDFLDRAGVPMAAIRGVISLDTAAYDLPALAASSPFHGMLFGGLQSTWSEVSPLDQIPNNPAKTPFLVFFSEGRSEAATQTRPFVEKLQLAGYPAFLYEALGRNHQQLDTRIGTPGDESTQRIQDFLKEFSH